MVDGGQGTERTRRLVVVSGYFGFGNLGDEAILEELSAELKQLIPGDDIVVLSQKPAATRQLFGVSSVDRWDLKALCGLLKRARLFISGGGGLFQDTRSAGSVLYYGCQIMLAHALGVPVLIYAQGIGPIRGALAKMFARQAFRLANLISVRDTASLSILTSWGLAAERTADPVWCLTPTALPESLEEEMGKLKASEPAGSAPIIGLSLRPSPLITEADLACLERSLAASLPAASRLIILPLQKGPDTPPLEYIGSRWQQRGRQAEFIDTAHLERPSQWLALMSRLDLLVSMRLHALIMALKMGVPAVGIAYDPKVAHVLMEFEQPILNLTKERSETEWTSALKAAYRSRAELSARAVERAEAAKNLACQNFNLLARILDMQSDP